MIHIVLVTDSPVPVVAPLIALGAKEAVLVHTDYTAPFALKQAEVLSARGVACELFHLSDGLHLEPALAAARGLLERFGAACVNITGGSKLMSIAFYEVFCRSSDRLYYVHLHHNGIVWLHPAAPDMPINDSLTLSELLICRQYAIESRTESERPPSEWYTLAGDLVRGQHRVGLGMVLKNIQKDKPVASEQGRLIKLFMDRLCRVGLMAQHKEGYRPVSGTAKNFLIGGWLEWGVYDIIEKMADPHISEIALGVKIANPNNTFTKDHPKNIVSLKNEIDIAIVRQNTLYLIECKNTSINADVALKLDAIRDTIGDIKAKALLISTAESDPLVRSRAREYGIDLADWHEFNRLPEFLARWLGAKSC